MRKSNIERKTKYETLKKGWFPYTYCFAVMLLDYATMLIYESQLIVKNVKILNYCFQILIHLFKDGKNMRPISH